MVGRGGVRVRWVEGNSRTDHSRTSPRIAVLHAIKDDKATANPILFAMQSLQEAEAGQKPGQADEDSRSLDSRCRADIRMEISRASSHHCQ